MHTLVFKKVLMQSAELGAVNCLPDMMNDNYIHASISVSERVTEEERENIGKGMIPTLLPYMVQDGYDRSRTEKEFDAAILENEYLKATFIPQLGGRLWSLYDKKAGKELLYANDVFQPCNLALRNAWFSGGVEWNVGIKGHNPLTCSPMFAQQVTDHSGNPMLRMYEYERIRGVSYSLTVKLEEDMLLVHVNIENTEKCDKYMYWWSNIAVEETPDTRVIVPAEDSFYCMYDEGAYRLDVMHMPCLDGVDVSYTKNLARSRDFFYKIPPKEDKWITALDKNGYGLMQLSTSELIGRKTFAWGQGNGGKHWNQWLSDCGKSYIEIQAGLLKTQLEHFVMKGESTISFTEGYTAMSADPRVIHADYFQAQKLVKELSAEKRLRVKQADFTISERGKIYYLGSGYGALQNMISDQPVSAVDDYCEDSLGKEQEMWVKLLKTGVFTEPEPLHPIISYVNGKKWIALLQDAADGWHKYYQLGVLYYQEGDRKAAEEAFEKSLAFAENPWAYRNLAQLKKISGDHLGAVADMRRAVNLKKDYIPLLVNAAESMLAAKCYEEWINLYHSLDKGIQNNGRVRMFYAAALHAVGKNEEARKIITPDFVVADIKEGEFSLSRLWVDIYREWMRKEGIKETTDEAVLEKYPLPQSLDFRMH